MVRQSASEYVINPASGDVTMMRSALTVAGIALMCLMSSAWCAANRETMSAEMCDDDGSAFEEVLIRLGLAGLRLLIRTPPKNPLSGETLAHKDGR